MTALAALCVAFAPPNADPLADLSFRPPAIPLITTDPFMQVWIRGNSSTAPNVTHWTGQPKTTTGLLRVDGTTYRYLGQWLGAAAGAALGQGVPDAHDL